MAAAASRLAPWLAVRCAAKSLPGLRASWNGVQLPQLVRLPSTS